MSGFFQELKQRRVFRVLLAYVLVGWAVIEVADTTFPYLQLPAWCVTLVIALVALGLPVALVLAWSFQITPEGVRLESRASARAGARSAGSRRGRVVWSVVVVVALAAGGAALWFGRERSTPVNPGAVVVLPLRTTGASDDIRYLGAGLADLLTVAFTGEVGPRALDSRTVLGAWRRAGGEELTLSGARALARRLGAGKLVLGEVVGRSSSVTVTASLGSATALTRGTAVSVTGPVDSLPALVEALAGKLLGVEAGEAEYRIPALAGTPLPALRAYLQGQDAYRNSRYQEAEDHFRAALDADSTFAMAAVGFRNAAVWEHTIPPSASAALELAWRHRDRLAPRDVEFVRALLGPAYPAPSTGAQRREAWERVVARAPDRAEAWFELGEMLFHYGALMDACEGLTDCAAVARPAFERAHMLAPDWATPLVHLLDIAYYRGESRRGLALADTFLARKPGSDYEIAARLQVTMLSADTAKARQMTRDLLADPGNGLMVASVVSVWGFGLDPGLGLAGIDSAMAHAATNAERRAIEERRYRLARNRGWPSVAASSLQSMAGLDVPRWFILGRQILDGLYWDGDPAVSATAAMELQQLTRDEAAETPNLRSQLCALGQWWAAQENLDRVAQMRDRVRPAPDEPPGYDRMQGEACAAVLDAAAGVLARSPDATALLDRADSIMRQDPPIMDREPLNQFLTRLFEAVDRPDRALRCVERHIITPDADLFASTYFREVGRLAANVGRNQLAAQYYTRYLAVRTNPEERLLADRDRVREALARLVAEGS